MPPVGFEPTISAGERPQTYAFDRAATGSGPTALPLEEKKHPRCLLNTENWTPQAAALLDKKINLSAAM